jgi:glycosyltransferase involved in cell wall biosynthesis
MTTMLYITDSMIPARSANSIQVMRMSQAFAQSGAAIELIVPWQPQKLLTQPGAFFNIRRYYGLETPFSIKFLPGPGNVLLGERWRRKWFLWLAPRYARLRKPDIVYTRNLKLAALLVERQIAVAVECHEYERFRERGDMSALLAVAHSPLLCLIVVISHSLKQLYVEFGFPESKILVAHDGVDESLLQSQAAAPTTVKLEVVLPTDKPVICYAGKFNEDRGIGLILEAARELPQAFFLLVGGTKGEVEIFQKKAKAECLNNIQFVGFVSPKDVAAYLQTADVLMAPYTTAIPTLNAASPLKVFEYMATGKPAVLSNIPTIGEVVTDGYDGILVEPDSSEALVKGLQRALSAEGAKIGVNARQTVTRYTWQARARLILEHIGVFV